MANGKPSFDPSKPFEPVAPAKPKFDPSKPFEAAEEGTDVNQKVMDYIASSLAETAKQIPQELLTSAETASAGALSGATLGGAERPIAELQAAVGGVPVEEMIARREQLKKEYPTAEMLGQTLGGMVGPVAGAGKAIAGAVESGAAKLIGEKYAQSALAAPVKGAATGAAMSPIPLSQIEIEKATGMIKPELAPSPEQVIESGAAIGGGIPAAGLAIKGAKGLGSALWTMALGPNKAVRTAYLQQPKEVTALIEEADKRALLPSDETAPGASMERGLPRTQVAEKIIEHVEPIRQRRQAVQEAKSTAEVSSERARAEFDSAVNQRKYELSRELEQKRMAAEQAAKVKRDFYKAGLTPEFADDVKVATEDLKRDVTEKSQQSYAILAEAKGQANLGDADIQIDQLKDELRTAGRILGPMKERVANMISYYAQGIGEIVGTRVPGVEGRVEVSGNVAYPTVKKIVQDIDQQLGYMTAPENRGKFSDLDRSSLLKIRRIIDSKIKEIPEYAEIMQDVAYRRELLEDASNLIGDEKKANFLARLNKSWAPGDPAQDIVVRLGRATGRPFAETLAEYTAMKQIGASQAEMAKVISELPESVSLRKMEATMALARRKELKPQVAPQEHAAWVKSQEDVDAINASLMKIKNDLDRIGSAGEKETTINFVSQAMRGLNPATRDQIVALKNLTGVDFERQIRAGATAEALMKSYPGGSRRAIVFQTAGRALGGALLAPMMLGGDVGPATLGIGSAIGATMDIYGGRVTKQLLDGYLAITGVPTVQKIQAAFAPLPKELKADIVNSFTRAVMNSERQAIPLGPKEIPVAKYEIQNSDHLSPLEKARAIMMVEKTGIVDTGVAQKIMLGGVGSNMDEGRKRAYNAIRAGGS